MSKQHASLTSLSTLTRTVATLFGNIFAVMAKADVIAAPKPTASSDLTIKHRLMNIGPAGARSRNLQRRQEPAKIKGNADEIKKLRGTACDLKQR